jgi:hypothetical protein
MKIIKPDSPDQTPSAGKSIFLAGSIDQGKAVNWQQQIEDLLSNSEVTIFNPRREHWNALLEQNISNDIFKNQVEWELDRLDECDRIFMYYDPSGPAPISLLELGLHASSGKIIVCCPDGYWRKGNVQVVCKRYNIPLYETLEDFINSIHSYLE